MIETLKLALREVVRTAERKATAQHDFDAKTLVPLDRGYKTRDPSSAPAEAQALLLADLQYESALAHARNVLAAADDTTPTPAPLDDVARIQRAIEARRTGGYERRKDSAGNQHTLSALTLESFTRHPTNGELQVWISDTSGPETRLFRMVQAVKPNGETQE